MDEEPLDLGNASSITIPSKDQYTKNGIAFFQFQTGPRTIVRDIYVDLKENTLATLKLFAKELRVKKYSKMTKEQLIKILDALIYFH
jgi:hypothetical protein